MGLKSHFENSLMSTFCPELSVAPPVFLRMSLKSWKKFFWKVGFSTLWVELSMLPKKLATSSASGCIETGLPSYNNLTFFGSVSYGGGNTTPECSRVSHFFVPSFAIGLSHQRVSSSPSSSSSAASSFFTVFALAFLTGVEVSDLTFLFVLLGPAFPASGMSSSLDSALIPLDFFEVAAFAVDLRRPLVASTSSSLSFVFAFAFFFAGAAAAFFSSLRIATASFSACFSICCFLTANFLPMGASESDDSPIWASLARGGFLDTFPFVLLIRGASSESDSADEAAVMARFRRLLCRTHQPLIMENGDMVDAVHTSGLSSSSLVSASA